MLPLHYVRRRMHEGEHNANVLIAEFLSRQERIGVWITQAVGSMWCAYVFVGLASLSLPAALRSHDPVILVSWISQTFLQLVLLSVIMVGQTVLSRQAEIKAEVDHHTMTQLLQLQQEQMVLLHTLADPQFLAKSILAEWDNNPTILHK